MRPPIPDLLAVTAAWLDRFPLIRDRFQSDGRSILYRGNPVVEWTSPTSYRWRPVLPPTPPTHEIHSQVGIFIRVLRAAEP